MIWQGFEFSSDSKVKKKKKVYYYTLINLHFYIVCIWSSFAMAPNDLAEILLGSKYYSI
jgi:hypothetical protein